MIELIGYMATILISISSLPQIIKSWRTKSTGDLSWAYIALIVSSMLLWTIYATALNIVPVLISSLITILGYGILSYLKLTEKGEVNG